MYELTVKTHFAAAHQLRMVAEKCENLHGHNWKIEVTVKGEKLNDAGVLIDFGELKEMISTVINGLDHKYLNEHESFNDKNPSSENIAFYICTSLGAELEKKAPTVSMASVTAWESDTACAKYIA